MTGDTALASGRKAFTIGSFGTKIRPRVSFGTSWKTQYVPDSSTTLEYPLLGATNYDVDELLLTAMVWRPPWK